MKNLTATQIRQRLGKCIDSAHKETALRDVRNALRLAKEDPIGAARLLDCARFHLNYAEAITRRLNEI